MRERHPEIVCRKMTAKSYLLIYNVGKRQNFGQLLRSACAFGVTAIFIVGAEKLSTFGNQGTSLHCEFRHFPDIVAAKTYLVENRIKLVGIEIAEGAAAIESHPFDGDTCFMLGNEGTGMNEQQMAACDSFVYVPQYSGATASLNVFIAGSIVMHHFAVWAGFSERQRSGQKFVTEDGRGSLERFQNPTEWEKTEIERKRADRAEKKLKVSDL